jgi:hypothetical protein
MIIELGRASEETRAKILGSFDGQFDPLGRQLRNSM